MPEIVEFRKVRDSLPALVGAFGQFDEVGLYTFGTTVQKVQEFTPASGNKVSQAMERIRKKATGRDRWRAGGGRAVWLSAVGERQAD